MNFSKNYLESICSKEKIIIYGAHQVAKELFSYMRMHNYLDSLIGFAVTEITGNPTQIDGYKVLPISSYREHAENVFVLVATPEKFHGEIQAILEEMQFENVVLIGVKGMSMLENEDMLKYINAHFPELDAKQCEKEYCCLEMMVAGSKRRFLSLGAYPLNEKSKAILEDFARGWDDYSRLIRIAEDRKENEAVGREQSDIEVLIVGGRNQIEELSGIADYEKAIVVGDKGTVDKVYRDDIGVNISDKNSVYAEMTATYWLWKNSDADYKGISHYRRRFVLEDRFVEEIKEGKYDVILSTPRVILPSLKESFNTNTSLREADFDVILDAVTKKHPEMATLLKSYFEGSFFYPTNMLIAQKSVFDEYCSWLFDILFEIESAGGYAEIRTRSRYNAYVAEVLTSFYFIYYKSKYRIGIAEYRLD